MAQQTLQQNAPGSASAKAEPIRLEDDISVKGRFARFTSAFWSLALPAISARYVWEATDQLFNPSEKILNRFKDVNGGKGLQGIPRFLASNLYALAMGATMLSIVGIYGKRTLDDIKTLCAEAVGLELGKPKEDVGIGDIFFRSQNALVKTTRDNFIKKTLIRAGVASSYMLPWQDTLHPPKSTDTRPNKGDNIGAKFGTGAMATYLFVDGFYRNKSFFEALQELVDVKINHNDVSKLGAPIEATDIMVLSVLHRKALDKTYKTPAPDSPAWQNEMLLCQHVADLMNNTYHNPVKNDALKDEPANFTVGKLVYLMGNGYLDRFPESMAYVNIANYDIDLLKKGVTPREAIAALAERTGGLPVQQEQEAPQPERRFADNVPPPQSRIPAEPRTKQEFAAMTSGHAAQGL